LLTHSREQISRFCTAFAITLIEHGAAPIGGYTRG
jgi:hypothetical protein